MLGYLKRRWFLLLLISLLGLGQWLGTYAPGFTTHVIQPVFSEVPKTILIVSVLFLMSVTLDSRQLWGTLAAPGPVLWASLVNAVLIPLAAPLLMPLQVGSDFSMGLLIAASVPSTMAAASVWTRRAGGNDAISLLVTMLTNGTCFLFTPFWLRLFSGAEIQLDVSSMMQRLFLTALLPTLSGQLCRIPAAWAATADRLKTPLGIAAQVGILGIVFASACEAGVQMGTSGAPALDEVSAGVDLHPPPTAAGLLICLVSCLTLHLGAMAVAAFGGRASRMARRDLIGVAFASSQKTLPIGVLIATDPTMFGAEFPWAIYPMLIYHASQLFADTAVADWIQSDEVDAEPEPRASETCQESAEPLAVVGEPPA